MGSIILALLGALAAAGWIAFRTTDRNGLIIMAYGPAFFVLFGPLVWVLFNVPLMLSGERGGLIGIQMAVFVYMVGGIPAFIAGLLHSIALLSLRKQFLASPSRILAKGIALGALAGGISTLIVLGKPGMAPFGVISGGVCGGIFTRNAAKRLGLVK